MTIQKYNTEQRKDLFQYMAEFNSQYVSVEDIRKYLKDKNINVGQTTIYRFLNTLEKQGKVRVELRERTKYYQYISDECNHHYHLKCEKCGQLIHFKCKEFQEFNKHISKEHNFQIDNHAVIYGVCENCMERGCRQRENDKN